jgi:Spy/CpxP family protein refolding chaperone
MKRRTMIGAAVGVATTLAAGVGAATLAGHGGGRHAIMRRVVIATLEDALDAAEVRPEQRAAIHAARDRVLAAIDAERASHGAHLEQALALFEAERLDPVAVERVHQETEAARARIRLAIHEAIVEAHDVLTADQRKAIADYVRRHHGTHGV